MASAGVLCVAVVPALAAAAGSVATMTPGAMSVRIHGLVPQIPTDNTSPLSLITAAICRGVGAANRGRFNTFRCGVAWSGGRSVVWARALAKGQFCASSTGLAACPPGAPAAGDPRICINGPEPPTADPNRCALASSEVALIRAMHTNFADPNWLIRNASCKGANVSHTCTFSSHTAYGVYYTATIGFAQVNNVWTATIVTTGGGGTSTCAVEPDATTAAGTPSVWSSGPTPTCTQ